MAARCAAGTAAASALIRVWNEARPAGVRSAACAESSTRTDRRSLGCGRRRTHPARSSRSTSMVIAPDVSDSRSPSCRCVSGPAACYHGVPSRRRYSYVTEVAAVTRPGGDLYLAGICDPPASWRLVGARGVDADDLRRRFGADFDLVGEQKAGRFVLYHLVRTGSLSG